MRINVIAQHKSIPAGMDFEIPDFCILTGKNGSGKSHLLEAMTSPNITRVIGDGDVQISRILHVGFNGLSPQVDEVCDQNQVINNINNWWNQINNIVLQYKQALQRGEVHGDGGRAFLPRTGQNPELHSIILKMMKDSGKNLNEITQDIVSENIEFSSLSQGSMFMTQCAMIFKSYQSRRIKNDLNELMSTKYGNPDIKFLSEDGFRQKYGPPPWELINDTLSRAELPYKVVSPELGDYELPYRLRLVDTSSGVDISVNDLSSGEKVLMSLALAIYNAREGGIPPELLLLDEPDAPLHPQFSRLLIETLEETIVKKTGVKVIMTTHSPSTVAMAPNNSVFEMDRVDKTPRMVSNAHAVKILTDGIDYLRVSFERRRQVFVESKYDVEYYQRLYALLRRQHGFVHDAVFLEPHSGTSNCSDVIDIVNKLQESGSDLVFGVIDFDNENKSNGTVSVLGAGARYAIESYLLDPLYVALALIRYKRISFSDLGIFGNLHTYVDARNLSVDDCQSIVNSMLSHIGINSDDSVGVVFENGFHVNYPKGFLFLRGHDYEEKLKESFPELNAISRGKGDSALKLGILEVIEEYPQFLPVEIHATFAGILGRSEAGT